MPKENFLLRLILWSMNNLRNEELLKKFGEHVRQLRLAKGVTQEALSYDCDMELSQIHRIEKGKVNTTLSTLEALAKGLNTTISELLKDL